MLNLGSEKGTQFQSAEGHFHCVLHVHDSACFSSQYLFLNDKKTEHGFLRNRIILMISFTLTVTESSNDLHISIRMKTLLKMA